MLIVADGHVHLHACYSLTHAFSSAMGYFNDVAGTRPFWGCCFLTEMADVHVFEQLCDHGDEDLSSEWHTIDVLGETVLRLGHTDGSALHLIAGRQIVTAEKIEVLGLGMRRELPDGNSLTETIDAIHEHDGLAVLPWGFGKWTGHRRATLKDYLRTAKHPHVSLGDIKARPRAFGQPRLFEVARAASIRILPGTDPLPFETEAGKIGSYGFQFEGDLDESRPWESLRALMQSNDFSPTPYGSRLYPLPFMAGQIRLRLQKSAAMQT